MENKPPTSGVPGAANNDPTDTAGKFADGRGISDMVKNKGKKKDDATYADEKTETHEAQEKSEEEKEAETKPEDFEPFNLDAIDDKDEKKE